MVITRKKMPDVHLHARYWGFVEEVRLFTIHGGELACLMIDNLSLWADI